MPPGATPSGRGSLRQFGFHPHQRPRGWPLPCPPDSKHTEMALLTLWICSTDTQVTCQVEWHQQGFSLHYWPEGNFPEGDAMLSKQLCLHKVLGFGSAWSWGVLEGATRPLQSGGINQTPNLFKKKLVFQHKFPWQLCNKLTVRRNVVEWSVWGQWKAERETCVGCWSCWQELETDVTVCGELIDYLIFTFPGHKSDTAA